MAWIRVMVWKKWLRAKNYNDKSPELALRYKNQVVGASLVRIESAVKSLEKKTFKIRHFIVVLLSDFFCYESILLWALCTLCSMQRALWRMCTVQRAVCTLENVRDGTRCSVLSQVTPAERATSPHSDFAAAFLHCDFAAPCDCNLLQPAKMWLRVKCEQSVMWHVSSHTSQFKSVQWEISSESTGWIWAKWWIQVETLLLISSCSVPIWKAHCTGGKSVTKQE